MTRTASLILLPGLGASARQWEPQRAEFPELTVPQAGHLLNLTHPEQVNAMIRTAMEEVPNGRSCQRGSIGAE